MLDFIGPGIYRIAVAFWSAFSVTTAELSVVMYVVIDTGRQWSKRNALRATEEISSTALRRDPKPLTVLKILNYFLKDTALARAIHPR